MTRLTRDEIIKAVGQVDDVTIAEMIGTGATAEELAEAQAWRKLRPGEAQAWGSSGLGKLRLGEAQAWALNDDPLLNAGKKPPTKRARGLIAILGRA